MFGLAYSREIRGTTNLERQLKNRVEEPNRSK